MINFIIGKTYIAKVSKNGFLKDEAMYYHFCSVQSDDGPGFVTGARGSPRNTSATAERYDNSIVFLS